MTPKEAEKISLEAALAVMEGDIDILKSVVGAFVEETPEMLQLLNDAIQAKDQRTAQRAIHTIKGSYRILQQPQLVEVWDHLEALSREARFDEISALVPAARRRTERVVDQMSAFLEEN